MRNRIVRPLCRRAAPPAEPSPGKRSLTEVLTKLIADIKVSDS
jgi:hypothetical protein